MYRKNWISLNFLNKFFKLTVECLQKNLKSTMLQSIKAIVESHEYTHESHKTGINYKVTFYKLMWLIDI